MSPKYLCALLLLTLPLSGAESWKLPLFTSEPHAVLTAASSYSIPDGVNAMTLDYSVQVQLDSSGKMTKTTRTITRIQRVQAIRPASRVQVSCVTWRENRPKLKARVITPDSHVHILDERAVNESATLNSNSDPSTNVKILTATLPEVAADCVIEVEIEESDREAAYPHGRLAELTLGAQFPIAHFALKVVSSSPLRAEARGFPEGTKVLSQAMGAQTVTVESANIFPDQNPSLLPPEVPPLPTVTFTNVPSWQTIARWYSDVIARPLPAQAGTPGQPAADQLQAIEDALENVRAKVHDNGAAFGSSTYTPRSPAEVLQSGIADSKDQAALLISKLADIGVPAKFALIGAGSETDAVPGLPGVEAFNRALVYIPGQHPLWIDPSAEFTSVSRLPLADQGRRALIVDPATTELVRTPESTATDNRQVLSTEIRLQDGNQAIVKQTVEAQGTFEDLLRPVANSAGTDADEKNRAQMQLVRLSGAQRITKIHAGEPRKLLAPCRVEIEAEGYRASQVTDEGGFIDLPGPGSAALQRIAKALQIGTEEDASRNASPRKFDYYLPPAFTEEASYHLIPPTGYQFRQPPSPASYTIGPIEISSTAKLDPDGTVRVKQVLISPKMRYTPQEVSAMRRAGSKLSAARGLRFSFLNVAQEKLAKGEWKDAVGLFRRSAAAEPSNVNAALRLAGAYVEVGARAEAVKVCNQVLQKDPNNASAWLRLGWVYTHDEFGRPFAPGMNLAEAEKAYRKAIDLGSRAALLQLATMYTYNAAGIRFGNSARLSDALRSYTRAGLDALAQTNLVDDYALTLLFARNYAELRRFFHYPQAESVNPALRLAAIAGSTGPNSAKEEADFVFPASAKRRTALAEAARYLWNARDFEPASGLLQLAGTGPGLTSFELSSIRKTKSFDETVAARQPAIAALQRFIVAVLNPPDPDAWKKFVLPEMRNTQLPRLRLALLDLFDVAQSIRQPSTWPAIADVLATASDFTPDGNDASGYRIRIPDQTKKRTLKTIAYVVKRGDEYLLLGLTGGASRTGEALLKAESGDLVSARQWLDWAKDEMQPSQPAADPMTEPAFQRLWLPKSNPDPNTIKAAAASVAATGTEASKAIQVLTELREQAPGSTLQAMLDQALAQGLLAHQRYSEAVSVLRRLQTERPSSVIVLADLAHSLISIDQFPQAADAIQALERLQPASIEPQRLRESLLAQQGKFKEAAALQMQICHNSKAAPYDWNDLAWIGLFAQMDAKSMLDAAEKAAKMTQGRNSDVLHTLALVQADTGQLKAARENAYELINSGFNSNELLPIFGRIAEELNLPELAGDYYRRVETPDAESVTSIHSFAQMRLKRGVGAESHGAQNAETDPEVAVKHPE